MTVLFVMIVSLLLNGSIAQSQLNDDSGGTLVHAGQEASSEENVLPPIFVLNLDRSKDRWEKTHNQLVEAGIDTNVVRLPAVDGRALTVEELKNQSSHMAMYLQPRGVIGCYLSHIRFWKLVVERQYENAIVFEDDIQLVDGFKEKLISMLQQVSPDEYDVLLLGALGRVHPQGKDNFGTFIFSSYIGGNRPFKRLGKVLYQPQRPAGTHAYIVSQRGAQKLLELCPKATYHVDLDCWRHAKLTIRMFDPILVYQTFEDTCLTDVSHKRTALNRAMLESRPGKKLLSWAADPLTKQPWSHVLAEPIIQLGPGGPVLTVERHCIAMVGGCVLASALNSFGYKTISRYVYGGVFAFVVGIRSILWLLMNWKS